MSELIFDTFSLTITPNNTPSWNGNIPYISFQPGIRIVTVSLPINKVGQYTEYVNLDLWIEGSQKTDESEMSLSGILYSTRNISRLVKPIVVTPCQSFIEIDEDEDGELDYAEYDIIIAETFEEAVYALFEDTGWKVKIACELLKEFPVVTEMEPILTLNGSKLEQLSELLEMFAPNDLWDQQLVYVVNPFTNEILITPPTNGETNTNTLNADSARVFDISVNEKDIELPQKIYLQEDPSALFRHEDHFGDFGYRVYQYAFETSIHEDLVTPTHLWSERFMEWEKDLDIIAKMDGEQIIVGDTVIVDTDETSIFTIETKILYKQDLVEMEFPMFGAPYLHWDPIWFKWVTVRATDIKSRTEYSYIMGPPYSDPMLFNPCDDAYLMVAGSSGEDDWWNDLPYETEPEPEPEPEDEIESAPCISGENSCFSKMLPWITTQLTRDYGAIVIDKDHLPPYITSNEGLRIFRKKIISLEYAGRDVFYTNSKDQKNYSIPAFEDMDRIETSVTITEERYSYDELGNLVGVHEHKQTKTATEIIEEDDFKIYKPITDGLTSVITYTVTRKYDLDYNLQTTTVANVDADTVTGDITGPSAVSPMESIQEKESAREKLLRQNTQRTVLKLLTKTVSNVVDTFTGVVYVSMENLILEEMEAYLIGYYNVTPSTSYEVGFSSNFLDVRGIIGGYLQLTHTLDPNRGIPSALDTMGLKELYTAGIFEAMAIRPFRVDGVTMNWDGEGMLTVAVAAKQVV